MNNALVGQLLVFLVVGVALFLASMQLGGHLDVIAEIREQVQA